MTCNKQTRKIVKLTNYTTSSSRTVVPCIWIHSTQAVSELKIVETLSHKLLVSWFFRFFFFFFLHHFFSHHLAISYHSDYRPTIIDNEKGLHSQSHAVSSGMWALAPSSITHVEYVLPPLGPQNVAGSPIAPTEIAESNSSNVYLKTNALPQPQTIPPSHFSKDHTHHNIKYLEQLLDSSLATVAVIQFSGNTLADVLTPRAYDTFKALYALADLDAPVLSTKARGSASEIPTRSTFSDVGNDFPYSSNLSPPLPPTPSLAVSRTGRIHISISVDYVIYFSCAGLVAISGFVLFRLCERFFKM